MEDFLSVNTESENLKVQKHGLYKYCPATEGLSGSDKLIKYNAKNLSSARALWKMSHTIFLQKHLLFHVLFYVLIAFIVAAISGSIGNLDEGSGHHMATIVSYLTTIQGFMLGAYVGSLVVRWWTMRSACVGGLWATIDDICLLLSSHALQSSDRPFKQRVLRLALLSYALVYNHARGREDEDSLHELVSRGLMMEEELQVIKNMASKPQVVWVWISQLIHALAARGKIMYPQVMVPKFDMMCAKGRAAIGNLFTYTDTQLPYAFVHMLSTTIALLNFIIALKCGITLGFIYQNHQTTRVISGMAVFVEVCHVTLLPFAFQAFLLLGGQLADPLGNDFIDFPEFAYHFYMRDENIAFFKIGESSPDHVVEYLNIQ